MFLEDDKVIDHPMRLNFDSKKLIDGENLDIKDIFCKNGELGISAKEDECYAQDVH